MECAVNQSCLIRSPGPHSPIPQGLGSQKLWHLSSHARFELQGQLHGDCGLLGTPKMLMRALHSGVFERFGHWVGFSPGSVDKTACFMVLFHR